MLHLPALVAFGLARDLATPFWLASYAAAVVIECAVLFVLWRALGRATGQVEDLASNLSEAEQERLQLVAEKRQVTGELLISLARRNQALLHRQLAKIDEMEAREQDPITLSQLFAIDHLATRMRRNAESLLVLSGEESVRKLTRPTPMSEIIRGAVAEIEDYQRVDVAIQGDADVVGRAVVDVVHLLAELVENATVFSPPGSRVTLTGTRSRHGYSVTIADHGVGFSSADLEAKNTLLATPNHEAVGVNEMLGFLVVRRLANRFDINVRLASQPGAGTVVTVEIPASVLMRELHAVSASAPTSDAGQHPDAQGVSSSFPRQYLPADSTPAAPAPLAFTVPAEEPAAAPVLAAPQTPASAPVPAPAPIQAPVPAPAPALAPLVSPAAWVSSAFEGVDTADAFAGSDNALPAGLTQRVPLDSLAPQMRSGPVAPVLPGESVASPAPEHARSLLSAYRTGLTLGRSGIMDEPGLTPDRYAPPTDEAQEEGR